MSITLLHWGADLFFPSSLLPSLLPSLLSSLCLCYPGRCSFLFSSKALFGLCTFCYSICSIKLPSITKIASLLDVWCSAKLATACQAMARAAALAAGRTEAASSSDANEQDCTTFDGSAAQTRIVLKYLGDQWMSSLSWGYDQSMVSKMILLDNKSFRQTRFHLSS